MRLNLHLNLGLDLLLHELFHALHLCVHVIDGQLPILGLALEADNLFLQFCDHPLVLLSAAR